MGALGNATKAAERLSAQADALKIERERMLGLYRKGLITEGELEGQLSEVRSAGEALDAELGRLRAEAETARALDGYLAHAEELLTRLSGVAAEDLSFAVKRSLVETLVAGIKVKEVAREEGKRGVEVLVTYTFSAETVMIDGGTGIRAKLNPVLERAYVLLPDRGGPKGSGR